MSENGSKRIFPLTVATNKQENYSDILTFWKTIPIMCNEGIIGAD